MRIENIKNSKIIISGIIGFIFILLQTMSYGASLTIEMKEAPVNVYFKVGDVSLTLVTKTERKGTGFKRHALTFVSYQMAQYTLRLDDSLNKGERKSVNDLFFIKNITFPTKQFNAETGPQSSSGYIILAFTADNNPIGTVKIEIRGVSGTGSQKLGNHMLNYSYKIEGENVYINLKITIEQQKLFGPGGLLTGK